MVVNHTNMMDAQLIRLSSHNSIKKKQMNLPHNSLLRAVKLPTKISLRPLLSQLTKPSLNFLNNIKMLNQETEVKMLLLKEENTLEKKLLNNFLQLWNISKKLVLKFQQKKLLNPTLLLLVLLKKRKLKLVKKKLKLKKKVVRLNTMEEMKKRKLKPRKVLLLMLVLLPWKKLTQENILKMLTLMTDGPKFQLFYSETLLSMNTSVILLKLISSTGNSTARKQRLMISMVLLVS